MCAEYKSEIIKSLQESIDKDGDGLITDTGLIGLAFNPHLAGEYERREEMVRDVRWAKREVGAPSGTAFFKDIWPVVLDAYIEKDSPPEGWREPFKTTNK